MTRAHHVLTALALATVAHAEGDDGKQDTPVFAAPTQLVTPDGPISKKLYPSPAIFDVDGDGAHELVIGDLIGHFWVSESVEGASELTWTEPAKLMNGEEPLKLNNW